MFRLCLPLVFVVAGCAHGPAEQSCLDPATATMAQAEMERLVDHTTKVADAKSELVEEGCFKRKYLRSGYRIVVFKQPLKAPTEVQASMVEVHDGTVPPQACLADAEKTFQQLNLPQVLQMLSRVRSKEDWRWLDPDIGPAKWLECKPKRGDEYFERLQNFAHEVNHDAREEDCLYIAAERTRRCFVLPKEMPLARFARIQPKVNVPAIQEMLDWILDLYLGPKSSSTAVTLFDELNAYTLGTDVRVAAFEREGKRSLYDNKGHRGSNFLPLFLAQTAAYLTKLKSTDPAMYERTFGVAKENHANLLALFDQGEKAFEAWRKIASAPRDPMARVEMELWSFYRRMKSGL